MQPGTTGAQGYQTIYEWLDGSYYSCNTGAVNTCQLGDFAKPEVVAWASKGSAPFTVPANVTRACDILKNCVAAVPGSTVTIGSMPQWFGTATAW